jgi:5-carboxymethyl-2-hydroxymuconate isomerase
MPHLVIEYSATLHSHMQSEDVLGAAHQVMIESGLFSAKDIKTRAYVADDFLVGEKGQDGSFLHVTVSLLEGRTLEQKQALSDTLRDVIAASVAHVEQLSVDVQDMVRETYRKYSAS